MLYLWIKAIHLAAVIFWMAGMLYLPRLFVYHSQAVAGGELEAKMVEAEAKLLRIIMNPAMIVAFVLGLVLIGYNWGSGAFGLPVWLWVKVGLAVSLIGYHGYLAKTRKAFLTLAENGGGRPKSEKHFRMINEVPAITTLVVVVLAVVKPVIG